MRIKYVITFALGAAGGFIAGLLASPKSGKENRNWLSKQSKETMHRLESGGKKVLTESEKKIDRFSKGIRSSIKENVPDLYEATADISFSEEDEEML